MNIPGGRWCRQCGQYKPLAGFDKVEDKMRRFCGPECKEDYLKEKESKPKRSFSVRHNRRS